MSDLDTLMNRINNDLQGILNNLRIHADFAPPPPPIPIIRTRPATHQTNPSAYFPVIPTQFAKAIRPEWSDEDAKKASKIITYRQSEDSGRFRCDFRLRECPRMFWTGIRITHTRNAPAKFRILLGISNEVEYTLFDWAPLPNKEWVGFPSILPAFYTSPGKIYIQVDIPDVPGQSGDIHVSLDMVGFENLLCRYPRFDLNDQMGNRLLTWIPARDSDVSNDATLYHPLYDPEPPFEPNCELL